MRRLLALLVAASALAGCAREVAPPDLVVGYPRVGDVATYELTGAYVEIARWENGHAFASGRAQARFHVEASEPVLDGARHVHPAFRVATTLAETSGGFVPHSQRFVSPAHEAVVQAWYPISQDQAVLSFDERGLPWLFGTSPLLGAELSRAARFPFRLPDNLGGGRDVDLAWVVEGDETVDGVATVRLRLEGNASLEGEAWMEPGSPWPVRVRLALLDGGLAPMVRADGAYPARMEARRVEVLRGAEAVPPRDPGATFAPDMAAERLPWSREAPPDGDAGYVSYALADAIADAKLLDRALAEWLAAARDPRLYRGTFADFPGPAEGTARASWLLQFVSQDGRYYEVEVERVHAPPVPFGVPRVNRSAPAEPPRDANHGWFSADEVPAAFVPLSEAVRAMRQVFAPEGVQIYLRSQQDPAGYVYFLDGGFERDGGRYSVVYSANDAFIQEATGPVTPRFASAAGQESSTTV
ncbi:MAG TPA: hypothetical protein VHH36_09300 [Candidatus Thermoplasmatota archaeon]|nr:hypothetical protein [Candidatus Thermoplasmatota archaeon]